MSNQSTNSQAALADEFDVAIRDSILKSAEFSYYPHRFEKMLNDKGAVETAKTLAASGDLQAGLKTLAKHKRLDLSLESIMLEDRFKDLFTPDLLKAAAWRLKQVK